MDQGGAGITSLPGSLALFSLNLLLLREAVSKLCLEASDSRSIHLRKVIRVKDGDFVDLAVRNGPKGKGKVFLREDGAIELELTWLPAHSNDLYPISLVVAQCRPQTCRRPRLCSGLRCAFCAFCVLQQCECLLGHAGRANAEAALATEAREPKRRR